MGSGCVGDVDSNCVANVVDEGDEAVDTSVTTTCTSSIAAAAAPSERRWTIARPMSPVCVMVIDGVAVDPADQQEYTDRITEGRQAQPHCVETTLAHRCVNNHLNHMPYTQINQYNSFSQRGQLMQQLTAACTATHAATWQARRCRWSPHHRA